MSAAVLFFPPTHVLPIAIYAASGSIQCFTPSREARNQEPQGSLYLFFSRCDLLLLIEMRILYDHRWACRGLHKAHPRQSLERMELYLRYNGDGKSTIDSCELPFESTDYSRNDITRSFYNMPSPTICIPTSSQLPSHGQILKASVSPRSINHYALTPHAMHPIFTYPIHTSPMSSHPHPASQHLPAGGSPRGRRESDNEKTSEHKPARRPSQWQ